MASILSAAARRLEGKVAIITGGASGIGESAVRLFAKHGAKVLIADTQTDRSQSLCEDLKESSPYPPSFVHCDVSNETDVKNAVDATVAKHGKLDIMYNNAGVADDPEPDIWRNDAAAFERVLRVNLLGAFLGTKHAAQSMVTGRVRGSIVTTASVCSAIGGVASHAYTSSKHGAVGMMRNAAVELGRHGIRVNCVSPYLVATPLSKGFFELDDGGVRAVYGNLKGAVLTPGDVAEAALFLASDESKYVSGHNLLVDGGFTIVNPGFCMFGDL